MDDKLLAKDFHFFCCQGLATGRVRWELNADIYLEFLFGNFRFEFADLPHENLHFEQVT